MANVRLIKQSFSGGEISPEMFGRIEDAGYQSGLARCENFMVRPQGSVENRGGLVFVRPVKDSRQKVRLMPFTYSETQTLVLEMGVGYCRFHTLGGTVMSGDEPYEIATPYAEADLPDIHYVQSADVMTLVHPNHAPRELRRYGATDWRLETIAFQPAVLPPANVRGEAVTGGGTDKPFETLYAVTAVGKDGIGESPASQPVAITNNLYITGNKNKVLWDAVAGALRYKVYKKSGGLYGYIGQTDDLELADDNIAPDLSVTPPVYDEVFASGGISSVAVADGGSGYVHYGGVVGVNIRKNGGLLPEGLPDVLEPGREYAFLHSGREKKAGFFRLVFEQNGGQGAQLRVRTLQRRVVAVAVLSPGNDYSAPALRFEIGHKPVNGFLPAPTVWETFAEAPELDFVIDGAPTVNVSDPTGAGAVLRAKVAGGKIEAVEVLNQGRNYTAPQISIAAALGSGATIGKVELNGQDYPAAVSYFQQRRVFAGTFSKPQHVWMTKSGTESNMAYSIPTRSDDRIAFRIAAREAGMVRHIVPLAKLMLLSSGTEWNVGAHNSDALTPSNISVSPQSYIGASNVQPVMVNNTLIYGAARGGHVRELAYNWQANGYVTGDLSLRCTHLFDGFDIVDMALAKAPYPVLWAVSSSGKLLGCTYVPEHQIGAWHQHSTDGVFESCACVAEGDDDVLYCVVRREINGEMVRYIERMSSRSFDRLQEAFFVDCGLSYRGEPVTEVSGLGHLEGKTVSILGDGAVMPQQVVRDGKISLPVPASVVHAGLPIEANLQTVPLAFAGDSAFGQGRMKNVNKLWMRVYRSGGIFAGQSDAPLTEYKQRTIEPAGTPPALKTDEIEIMLKPQWSSTAQITVRQVHPLPLTVLNMTAEVAVGG